MTPDSEQGQSNELEALARARFAGLTAAEVKVVRAAPRGEMAVCGPNQDDDAPENDAGKGDKWGTERHVRADLIRWLFVNGSVKDLVDPGGIQIYGARVSNPLDLSNVLAPFGLTLRHTRLTVEVHLEDLTIPYLDFQGSWAASIGGDRMDVKGTVFLRHGFIVEGAVQLGGASIGGDLTCRGASFKNAGGDALYADGVRVKGDVFLSDGFRADGEVRLLGAEIGGDLDCSNSTFKNSGGDALAADRLDVKGAVFFRDRFSAEGRVSLSSAQIGGNLDCDGAKFTGKLDAAGAQINGNLRLTNLVDPQDAEVTFANAFARALMDDGGWPGKLSVDGFVYQRISEGPTDAGSRLVWFAHQQDFKPQPYRQLAKVLSEEGYEDDARKI